MPNADPLKTQFPALGRHLRKESLAVLPTPVRQVAFEFAGGDYRLYVKCDDMTGEIYGGNKVRKLEYLLRRARDRSRRHIGTFGAVGSHHALATALYARHLGLSCTCFLSHQIRSPSVPLTLKMHVRNNTDVVRYGGSYANRISILREHLWHKNAWVIPAGGSSWLGAIGFVSAALEIAEQIEAALLPRPDKLYVAAGTLGTVAGLAVGLALAGLPTEVHAVRVTEPAYSGEKLLHRLIHKIVDMMRRLDPSIPQDLPERVNVRVRHSFFAGGYAHSNDATDFAVRFAQENMGLTLETTYTGKAMAALLADIRSAKNERPEILFWNTYNSVPLPATEMERPARGELPDEFMSYFP